MKVWKKRKSLLTGNFVPYQINIYTQYEQDIDRWYDWVNLNDSRSKAYKLTNFYSPMNFPYDKYDGVFSLGVVKHGHHMW